MATLVPDPCWCLLHWVIEKSHSPGVSLTLPLSQKQSTSLVIVVIYGTWEFWYVSWNSPWICAFTKMQNNVQLWTHAVPEKVTCYTYKQALLVPGWLLHSSVKDCKSSGVTSATLAHIIISITLSQIAVHLMLGCVTSESLWIINTVCLSL